MNPFVIDAFEYSRLREQREGWMTVSDFARLSEDMTDKSGSIHWSLHGSINSDGLPQLELSVSGNIQLVCQRCLGSFDFDIASESFLILATDETQADEVDALLDDDAIDVIIGSRELNVVELMEDEILLGIPLSPKHLVCPDIGTLEAMNGANEPSPFAVLKEIK
jgi:uncharacterized protein